MSDAISHTAGFVVIDGRVVLAPAKPPVPPCARCKLDGVYSDTRVLVRDVPLCSACVKRFYELDGKAP